MKKKRHDESGQMLIIMVFILVGLLVVVGLAVDGGTVFLERRRMQNSADAGTLAGTRLLAAGICGESVTDADILTAIQEYAGKNGVQASKDVIAHYIDSDESVLGRVGDGTIPDGSTGISATTAITRPTTFMGMAGIEQAGAGGSAVAMTGPIVQFPGGILPLGVHVSVVEGIDAGQDFSVLDVVNKHSGGDFCVDENGNGTYNDAADWCISDVNASHNAQRGWLNINFIYNKDHVTASDPLNRARQKNIGAGNCNQTPPGLQGYASGDCPYTDPVIAGAVGGINGDFIHGGPGAKTSVLGEIKDTYAGTDAVVYAPIFDVIYTANDMKESDDLPTAEAPDGYNKGGGWPTQGGGSEHAFFYHIVGFVGVKVNDGAGNHTLDGEFVEALISDGVISPSSGYGTNACSASETYGIQLWK